MADAVSLAASIAALIEIANRVIKFCNHCIDSVKDARRDMQMIMGEVMSLRGTIESLNSLDLHPNTRNLFPSMFAKDGPVEACQGCLVSLETLLQPGSSSSRCPKNKQRKITLAELAWPLKEPKARKLLAEISLHKATLLFALTGDMAHDIKDVKSTIHGMEYAMAEAQRQDVYRWLELTNPSPLHNRAIRNHEPETCAWLLRLDEWENWLRQPDATRLLWVHGIPGAGKTVLASFLIEEIKKHCGNDTEVGHAYYYCHHSHNQDEAAPFLRWSVSQLCRQAGCVPDQIQDLYKSGCEPNIPGLENALQAIVSKFKTCYIIIDAVDESQPRGDLLSVIATVAADKRFRGLKILATSRCYPDIVALFKRLSFDISMSNPEVDIDIRKMVHSRLHSSQHMKRFSDILDHIEHVLVWKAKGMFQWVHCQIHSLEKLRDESQVLEALKNLPKDLVETYVRGLRGVPDADRPFVRRIFFWIVGHTRLRTWLCAPPGIHVKVLLDLVSYEQSQSQPGLAPTKYTVDDIKVLCGCFISVFPCPPGGPEAPSAFTGKASAQQTNEPFPADSANQDQDIGFRSESELFVSLAHYTVMEFLESPHILDTDVAYLSMPRGSIAPEFTKSILLQALQSDPSSSAADWIRDREAHCLMLGCSLSRKVPGLGPDLQDLFLEYLNPNNSHYKRLRPIQDILRARSEPGRKNNEIQHLPLRVLEKSTTMPAPACMSIVLNIRLILGKTSMSDELVRKCLTLYGVPSERELCEVPLSAVFLSPTLTGISLKVCKRTRECPHSPSLPVCKCWVMEMDGTYSYETIVEGTINEILAINTRLNS